MPEVLSQTPEASSHEALIRDLSSELSRIQRLRPPIWRTLGWMIVVTAFGLVLARLSDLGAMWERLGGASDMWLAASGSALTALLAALASFETAVPGRSRW